MYSVLCFYQYPCNAVISILIRHAVYWGYFTFEVKTGSVEMYYPPQFPHFSYFSPFHTPQISSNSHPISSISHEISNRFLHFSSHSLQFSFSLIPSTSLTVFISRTIFVHTLIEILNPVLLKF